jgi:hypothetical protein
MKFNDFDWKDIILEAPGDDEAEMDDELAATDYAEADVDVEEGDPAEEESPTDENEEGDDADPADEDPLADEETEDGEDDADPADEDPLADEEGGSDSEGEQEEEQSDNAENNVNEDKQNANLINDYIELYKRMDTIMNQIRTDCKTNIRYNPNILAVRRNMTKLKEITYDYITHKFAKESYVANLYQFNLIIQALNVNIELLSSLMESNKKEKPNKKRK